MARTRKEEGAKERFWKKFSKTQTELEAQELQDEQAKHNCVKMGDCQRGEVVRLSGVVSSLTLQPKSTYPALELELYDGSGRLKVIFMGRRKIPGITAGVGMEVTGRVNYLQGGLTMYNPRYELSARA